MIILTKGIPINSGIAIGTVKIWERDDILTSIQECKTNNINNEINIINNALNSLKNKINILLRNLNIKEIADILNAHLQIAQSIVEEAINEITDNNDCATSAIKHVTMKYIHELQESGSELIGMRIDDIIDVSSQLISLILNKQLLYDLYITEDKKIILITNYIMPSEVILLRNVLEGLVTEHGGATSHSAILTRSLNVPYIIVPVNTIKAIAKLITNKILIIDGFKGLLILPEEKDSSSLTRIINSIDTLNAQFYDERMNPAVTIDGKYVNILANVGNIEDARLVLEYGGEGIGLLRLEFMYMNRKSPPNEEELFNTLMRMSKVINGNEIIVRALDAGGDKPIPYLNITKENNPFLGLRGIRLLLREHQEILINEIKAVLKASAFGKFGFMIPMVSSVNEIIETKKIMREIIEEFDRNNIKYGKILFGIMVEVPSIALIIDKVVNHIDFISLGTNDLTQYIMAADRSNEKVQYLYDELNPSVLRLIYNTVNVAKQHGVRVDVCGEIAGNEIALPILLSFNVDALSMNPVSIPKIKYIIRRLRISDIKSHIIKLLENFNDENDIKNFLITMLIKAIPQFNDLMIIYGNYEHPQQP